MEPWAVQQAKMTPGDALYSLSSDGGLCSNIFVYNFHPSDIFIRHATFGQWNNSALWQCNFET